MNTNTTASANAINEEAVKADFTKRMAEAQAFKDLTDASVNAEKNKWYATKTAKVGFCTVGAVAAGAAAALAYQHFTGKSILDIFSKVKAVEEIASA